MDPFTAALLARAPGSAEPYRRSADVLGEVLGARPGRAALQARWATVVALTADFEIRYPLIDGQGDFGSVDGTARRTPASPR